MNGWLVAWLVSCLVDRLIGQLTPCFHLCMSCCVLSFLLTHASLRRPQNALRICDLSEAFIFRSKAMNLRVVRHTGNALTQTHTLKRTHSNAYTQTHSLKRTHANALTQTHTQTHLLKRILSSSFTHSLKRTHTRTHSKTSRSLAHHEANIPTHTFTDFTHSPTLFRWAATLWVSLCVATCHT